MKSYIMENSKEAERLEQQSKNDQFKLSKELSHLDFSKDGRVLDAGCGSGLLGRYLKESNPNINYFGCDQSIERINFARSQSPHDFNFFVADLYNENFSTDEYDLIFSRYVLHHLENPKKVLHNLKNKLSINGRLIIVDADGIMVNLGTDNTYLLETLQTIKNSFAGNLTGARLLPAICHEVGFTKINYRIDVMDFQNLDRELEVSQLSQRLDFAKDFLINILGSVFEFKKFKKIYLNEVSKAHVSFYYNRFVIVASA